MTREILLKKFSLGILFLYTYFNPTVIPILTVGVFMLLDLFLALLVCIRTGEEIRSRALWRTASKFGAAGIFIIVAHLICTLFLKNVPGVQVTTGYLIFVEVKSIDEKALKIYGVSMFKWALDKMKVRKEEEKISTKND